VIDEGRLIETHRTPLRIETGTWMIPEHESRMKEERGRGDGGGRGGGRGEKGYIYLRRSSVIAARSLQCMI